MSDFTVIIPHRGNPLGLWATVQGCEMDLERSKFDYNYVIVTNGEELPQETKNTLKYVTKSGRLLKHIHSDDPMSPPEAREVGASAADGRLLFFFDNHCIVTPKYFERAVLDFENPDIDILHSTTRFYASDDWHYHYKLKLAYNFWAESATFPQVEHKPYKIAAGGHGGFVVRKSVWDGIGGYGPTSLFKGYGGEELIFDLKAALFGHSVYLDPKLVHFHYNGNRGYIRHFTDDYYTNMLVSANVIGGENWMYRVFDSFVRGGHMRILPERPMYDLLLSAYERSVDYAKVVADRSRCNLDELLKEFRQTLVAM